MSLINPKALSVLRQINFNSTFGLARKWAPFLIVSAFFFHITAATFTSLGVVLPHMIAEMNWSWSEAGTGFSLLALMVGLSAMAPAWSIRLWGVKTTFGIGGAIMIAGFSLLATSHGLTQYFVGASLAGLGYTLCATVPAVHYFNVTVPQRGRAAIIGAYMTIGGLGGVAGPLLVTGIVEATGSWRAHWWTAVVVTFVLTILALFIVNEKRVISAQKVKTKDDVEKKVLASGNVYVSGHDWTYREAIRTRQFYIIVAAMTLTLFCALTMNSWAVTHLGSRGISAAVAAGALSAHSLINAFARGLGGALGSRIDAKWLLVSALIAEAIGMLALALADNPLAIAIFVIGEGYGFGMCLFATTVLLVNYFGTHKNPEVFGSLNLITTIAMVGPVLAGAVAERVGGFGAVFAGCAVSLLFVLFAVVFMRPPQWQGEEKT